MTKILPLFSGLISSLKVFVIYIVLGSAHLADFSLAIAYATVLSLPTTLLNNQHLLHRATQKRYRRNFHGVGISLTVSNLAFLTILIIQNGLQTAYIGGIWYALMYFCEFNYQITKNINKIFLLRIINGSIFLAVTVIFKNLDIALISSIMIYFTSVFIHRKIFAMFKLKKNYFTSQVIIIKSTLVKTNVANLIPYGVSLIDYFLKLILAIHAGSAVLAFYTLMQGVENLLGQMLGGPYYRAQLQDLSNGADFTTILIKYSRFLLYFLITISLVCIIIFNQSTYVENSSWAHRIPEGLELELIYIFVMFRIFPLTWGAIGQFHLVNARPVLVTSLELLFRVSPLFVFLLAPDSFSTAYMFSHIVYSIGLISLRQVARKI